MAAGGARCKVMPDLAQQHGTAVPFIAQFPKNASREACPDQRKTNYSALEIAAAYWADVKLMRSTSIPELGGAQC